MTKRAALATQRETLRLAVAIADENARCHIECNSLEERIAGVLWWDTSAGNSDDGDAYPGVVTTVDTCLRYLELRDLIVRHPAKPHLVRFVDRIQLPNEA